MSRSKRLSGLRLDILFGLPLDDANELHCRAEKNRDARALVYACTVSKIEARRASKDARSECMLLRAQGSSNISATHQRNACQALNCALNEC
jgi:hypothetical protein